MQDTQFNQCMVCNRTNQPQGIIMKVTVIGAGNMGAAFVKQLTRAGHQVSVTARDLAKAQALAAANKGATAIATADAAAAADVLILATGYADAVSALKSAGNL